MVVKSNTAIPVPPARVCLPGEPSVKFVYFASLRTLCMILGLGALSISAIDEEDKVVKDGTKCRRGNGKRKSPPKKKSKARKKAEREQKRLERIEKRKLAGKMATEREINTGKEVHKDGEVTQVSERTDPKDVEFDEDGKEWLRKTAQR